MYQQLPKAGSGSRFWSSTSTPWRQCWASIEFDVQEGYIYLTQRKVVFKLKFQLDKYYLSCTVFPFNGQTQKPSGATKSTSLAAWFSFGLPASKWNSSWPHQCLFWSNFHEVWQSLRLPLPPKGFMWISALLLFWGTMTSLLQAGSFSNKKIACVLYCLPFAPQKEKSARSPRLPVVVFIFQKFCWRKEVTQKKNQCWILAEANRWDHG